MKKALLHMASVANGGARRVGAKAMTIGYWVTESKVEKMDFRRFIRLCQADGIRVVEIDPQQPLESQGPFDVVLHHISDLLARIKDGDERVGGQVNKVKLYLAAHPDTVLLDPFSAVRKLTDRFKMYVTIRKQLAFEDVQVPLFVMIREEHDRTTRLRKVREKGLSYPLLAKPKMAHKHGMLVVFNDHGLMDMGNLQYPIILQTFIPHSGVLFKIYVIGSRYEVMVRPSIKDLCADSNRPNFSFRTEEVSKPDSHSELNPDRRPNDTRIERAPRPDDNKLHRLVARLAKTTKLTLLGIDLIIERHTRRHYVIDLNYFPSYEGVSDVADSLYTHVVKQLVGRKPLPFDPPSVVFSTASEKTENE